VTPVEFRGDLWRQKTRVPGVSCGVVCVILCFAVLVEHRLVTDGRTDGQTDRQTDRQTDTGPWLVPRMHSIAAYSSTFYCTAKQAIWCLTLQHMTKSAWEQFTLASYSPNCGVLVPPSPANIGQCAFAPTTEEQNRWSACTVPSSISSSCRMHDAGCSGMRDLCAEIDQ